jgi:hypothetical protein
MYIMTGIHIISRQTAIVMLIAEPTVRSYEPWFGTADFWLFPTIDHMN